MEMLITMPKIQSTDTVQCVYIIKFGLGYCYIGATKNLNTRAYAHTCMIKNESFWVNKKIPKKAKSTASFEILELVSNERDLVKREVFYIKQCIDTIGYEFVLNKYTRSEGVPYQGKHIGRILRRLRIKRTFSPFEIEEKARVCRHLLHSIEEGNRNPSILVIKRLCSLYCIPYQIIILRSLDESNVKRDKLPAFRRLKPAMDALIDEFLN